jgi:hypothetical protein
VEDGKVTARAPAGTSCQRCNTVLKKPCELPGTADLREKVEDRKVELAEARKRKPEVKKEPEVKKVVRGGSEASGSKRKQVEVELPPRKKAKMVAGVEAVAVVEAEAEMTEGEYRTQKLKVLGRMARAVEKLEHGMEDIRLEVQVQNFLLQRYIATREGPLANLSLPTQEELWADEPTASEWEETEKESEEEADEGAEEK